MTGEEHAPYAVATRGDGSAGAATLELYLLRHAHAGDRDSWSGPDEDRPLTDKGRRQAKRLARFLRALHFQPEIIISSPKVRAAQTAEIVAAALKLDVALNARLAGDFGLAALERLLTEVDGQTHIVLVGHDPDFSSLLAVLCGASRIPLRKGALARIDLEAPVTPGGGLLRWLVTPDLLKLDG